MKQRHDGAGLRVHRREIRSLEAIAVEAGQRQILLHGDAAVLRRDDMVRLMGQQAVVFVNETVFAAPAGVLPDAQPERDRKVGRLKTWPANVAGRGL